MNYTQSESVKRLFRVIADLETPEACGALFEDLCTIRELEDMAQRLDAAFMLSKGENYQTIAKEVGISTATISRVNRCLRYGSGGYRRAIERYTEDQDDG